MRCKKMLLVSCFLVMIFSLTALAGAQTGSPQETLNQYIADLQKNPDDFALREKIIKHVRTMKPAPAVPKETERYMTRGIAAMKDAKSADDFKDAVKEFEKASLSAPWFANAYYNLGVAQDKAGLYAEAIKSLNLYLIASPEAPDAKTVEKLIYEIEYRQEKTQKESSPETVAEKEKKKFEEWLKKLDGRRYVRHWSDTDQVVIDELEIKGNTIIGREMYTFVGPTWSEFVKPNVWFDPFGRKIHNFITGKEIKGVMCVVLPVDNCDYRISEDTIVEVIRCNDCSQKNVEHTYKREK